MKISHERLMEAVTEIMTGLGAAQKEAELVADCLVRANMRGIHSHGVKYLGMISKRIREKMLEVPTRAEIIKESGGVSLVDGSNGLGQVAGELAMNQSLKNAKEHGIAITFVRHTNNVGFLSYYTMMAARSDMVGICGCNAAPSISLWGGLEAVLGSNPISLAFPGETAPLVMDLSVSNVARGKIREADRLNLKIPPTWAFGPDGEPTEDPAQALKGTLMPIGGPKGVALAIAVDLLAGMISGSKYSKDVKTFHKLVGNTGVGAFFIAINPAAVIDPALFKTLLSEYVVKIKGDDPGKADSSLFLPGEIEQKSEDNALREGIELDDMAIETLNTMLLENNSKIKL
ncbi:MAG: Ldh family oxidoreductase [Desulfobacteraceae bacterium]|nr:MAG: Ldh family oxidoreductase [Desulfobacteraceae bacterium]